MGSWSQSHDEYSRLGIAESRHGLAPVFPIAVGTPLLARDLLAVLDQPRAAGAGDNFAVQDRQPGVGHERVSRRIEKTRRKRVAVGSLTREHCGIPRTEDFAVALQIITARQFTLPSIMQKLVAQFHDRGFLVELDISQKAEPLAHRARDAKFSGRQHAQGFLSSAA